MDTRIARPTYPHYTLAEVVESFLLHAENTVAGVTWQAYAASCRQFVAYVGGHRTS